MPAVKWLITGGAGFIGCHAASKLRRAGCEVVVIDNLSRRGAEDNAAWLRSQGVEEIHRTDIRDAAALSAIVGRHADADAVLHLAGQVAVTSSVRDPRGDFEANALGTLNVLEAVRLAAGGRPAVLYASTNKVYGGLEHRAVVERGNRHVYEDLPCGVDESDPLDFHSPYGCSKGAGDQYVRDYARIYGMRTVVFRQSCIYGTRQFGIEDQGWVAWFCVAAILGREITIYGDGKQVRDALWADDLIDVYQRALDRIDRVSGQVYNIGGGASHTLSLLELVGMIEERLEHRLGIRFSDWRPGDQRVFVADVRKAERDLGWRPHIDPCTGVARLLDWVQDHRALLEKLNL